MHARAEQVGKRGHQLVTRHDEMPARAERNAAIGVERHRVEDAEHAREHGVVADDRVHVERNVGAVHGDVVIEQRLQAPIAAPSHRLVAIPEEPVMHEEHGAGFARCGDLLDGALRRINRATSPVMAPPFSTWSPLTRCH